MMAELHRTVTMPDEDPERVNAVLTSLATDLESADAAPTQPQREVLAAYRDALGRFESRWKRLADGALAALQRRLTRLGVKPAERR